MSEFSAGFSSIYSCAHWMWIPLKYMLKYYSYVCLVIQDSSSQLGVRKRQLGVSWYGHENDFLMKVSVNEYIHIYKCKSSSVFLYIFVISGYELTENGRE